MKNMNSVMTLLAILAIICLVSPVMAIDEPTAENLSDNETVLEESVNETLQEELVNETPVVDIGPPVLTQYLPVPVDPVTGTGVLEISVLCRHNLFSKAMTIERVDDGNTIPFTSGKLLEKDQFNQFNKTGGTTTIELRHDGTFSERYAPAIYAIKLLDGNGGQPEYSIVRVDAGHLSKVQFIGHAVSMVKKQPEPEPEDPCKDLVVTAGDIHRVGLLYWFQVDVTNPNDVFTISDVVITDSEGHTVYDFPIFALSGDTYSFLMPTLRSHRDHNPLTVEITDTECYEKSEV
jgi:hypothetical protein